MCSAPAFCAWRRLPLICWKLLIGVCVRDGLVASVCVYRTSAASVALRPRGWRAVAFPCWLHEHARSKRFDVTHCHSHCSLLLGGLCVRDGLAACLHMSHFCCFRRASSWGLARRRFPSVASGSKLLDLALIVRCCINDQLFLLCFGFIGANSNSNSMNSIRRAASSGR